MHLVRRLERWVSGLPGGPGMVLDVHISLSYPAHGELHLESDTLESAAGTKSPHQQFILFVIPITAFPSKTHCFWQAPDD